MSQNTFRLKDLIRKDVDKTNDNVALDSNKSIEAVLDKKIEITEKKIIGADDKSCIKQQVLEKDIKASDNINNSDKLVVENKDCIPIEKIKIMPKTNTVMNEVENNLSSDVHINNKGRSLNNYLKTNNQTNNQDNINQKNKNTSQLSYKIDREKSYNTELVNKKDNVSLANFVVIAITLGFSILSYLSNPLF